MAVLERIRSKSVLLFVIIIVALLAFILGDALTSGKSYFGTGTTIAKLGNAKVDYTAYQQRMNQESENQQRNPNQQQQDPGVLSQKVLTELLVEELLKNEYKDLGIVVTDKELTEAMTGANLHPAAMQFIYYMSQQLGLPSISGAEVYRAMNNPTMYNLPAELAPQLKQAWAAAEKDVENAMLRQKFDDLLSGLFVANNLDAQSFYNDVATTRKFTYAVKPLSSVTDEEVEITDADRQAAWEENKQDFKLYEKIRTLDYILVSIVPSQEDLANGEVAVNNALEVLNSTEGMPEIDGFNNAPFTQTMEKIKDAKIKEFLDTTAVGTAKLLRHTLYDYTLIKYLGTDSGIDSINVSFVTVLENADTIVAELNDGKTFADVIPNGVGGQDSLWMDLTVPGTPELLADAFKNNKIGEVFALPDTINGQALNYICRINNRHNPVTVYNYATASFTIDPSETTISDLSAKLNTFISNNSNATDFAANATEAGYTTSEAMVAASSPQVASNIPDSRTIVKWIMNAKDGQVMPVYQDSKRTFMLTLAVKHTYEDFIPWNAPEIEEQVNNFALANKKAQTLIDRYAGKAKDVSGYAQAMGVQAQTGDAHFTAPTLATVGFGESKLQGLVAGSPVNTVVGPVQGKNCVLVFMVTEEQTGGRDYTYTEYANQFANNLSLPTAQLLNNTYYMQFLLGGKDKVKNYGLNFIQGFGE